MRNIKFERLLHLVIGIGRFGLLWENKKYFLARRKKGIILILRCYPSQQGLNIWIQIKYHNYEFTFLKHLLADTTALIVLCPTTRLILDYCKPFYLSLIISFSTLNRSVSINIFSKIIKQIRWCHWLMSLSHCHILIFNNTITNFQKKVRWGQLIFYLMVLRYLYSIK